MSRRRAWVLLGVHVLIALHVTHWYATGRTLTPLEPSEGMEFSKAGIVNAGAAFFAIAILSTLVLGRFFCGWGCHVVALQDLCRWLLGRAGIRPRPMRSRLLLFVPAIAFFYMFLFPLVQRFSAGQSLAPTGMHFTTSQFWETFPGWFIGGMTLLICGFAVVYLLGSKGFCTYGCPYGGIFAPADRWAVGRIRVTDACEGCGHCTAVCTSNVRVHQEVRDFGMVVDPGCMKCMDCVSVCPKEALYFGFGRPAVLARPRNSATSSGPARTGRFTSWLKDHRRRIVESVIFAAGFMATSWLLFGAAYQAMPWWLWASLSLWLGAAAARRHGEYTLAEELLLGVLFLFGMGAFRGLYGAVPFLMSLGIGAILAFLGLLTLRLLWRPNVRLQQWTLRRGRKLTRAGYLFLAAISCITAVWMHAGLIQICDAFAGRRYEQSLELAPSLESAAASRVTLSADERRRVESGLRAAMLLERYGWIPSGTNEIRLTWFHLLLGNMNQAEVHLNRALVLLPKNMDLRWDAARFLIARGKPDEALAFLRTQIEKAPQQSELRVRLAQALAGLGRFSEAEDILSKAASDLPGEANIRHAHAVLLLSMGRAEPAIEKLHEALTIYPDMVPSRHLLGEVLCAMGRPAEGIEQLRHAARLSPRDAHVRVTLGAVLCEQGRLDEALRVLKEAVTLAPRDPRPLRDLANCHALRGEQHASDMCLKRAAELEQAARSSDSPDQRKP